MGNIKPLHYALLKREIDTSYLDFKTTKNIKINKKFIGQERALAAIQFGMTIESNGYNMYAMGPSGIGKHSLIRQIADLYAAKDPIPSDWCYIHNFDQAEKPIALELPAGKGFLFQQDMKKTIEILSSTILSLFESFDYRQKIKKIEVYFKNKYEKENKNFKDSASNKKYQIPYPHKKQYEKENLLKNKMVSSLVKPIIKRVKKKYIKFPEILSYLKRVQESVIYHADEFFIHDKNTEIFSIFLDNPELIKYKVNLLVDNRNLKGSPVIIEETPCYSNLISRVEYTTQQGVLTTNFSLIKAGSLHYANGGYLIIEARKLIKNRETWEALKNALYSGKIKIDPSQNTSDTVKTVSLEPMPIPFSTKIILIGPRNLYYLLCHHDSDFLKLFKVAVDFNEVIERNKKNIQQYAQLIGFIVQEENLLPFSRLSVAEIINYSSRLAEDNEKLSTHISEIKNLILESDYWARQENKKIVLDQYVKKAIAIKIHRMDRVREMYYEDILRQFITIYTKGKLVGQVNCLSVRRVGNFSFGHPTRVTARIKQGRGKFIDIQREIKLAGPMHSKAGLIIANFLAGQFNSDLLSSLSASLSFEQIYCWTDGDSASIGELCALLSVLADIPLKQCFAVTGSSDQYGHVQPVGGVNEKIEGFFDICMRQGLNGEQGVLIPAINVKNLMLRPDVVQCVKDKRFFIYPITTIDDAISLLVDLPGGGGNKKNDNIKNKIYSAIEKRLRNFKKNNH